MQRYRDDRPARIALCLRMKFGCCGLSKERGMTRKVLGTRGIEEVSTVSFGCRRYDTSGAVSRLN